MCSPIATDIFVGSASLLHLRPKFRATGMICVQDFNFGNLAKQIVKHMILLLQAHCRTSLYWHPTKSVIFCPLISQYIDQGMRERSVLTEHFHNVLTELVLFCSDRTFFQKFRNIFKCPRNILKIIGKKKIAKLCSEWAKIIMSPYQVLEEFSNLFKTLLLPNYNIRMPITFVQWNEP